MKLTFPSQLKGLKYEVLADRKPLTDITFKFLYEAEKLETERTLDDELDEVNIARNKMLRNVFEIKDIKQEMLETEPEKFAKLISHMDADRDKREVLEFLVVAYIKFFYLKNKILLQSKLLDYKVQKHMEKLPPLSEETVPEEPELPERQEEPEPALPTQEEQKELPEPPKIPKLVITDGI